MLACLYHVFNVIFNPAPPLLIKGHLVCNILPNITMMSYFNPLLALGNGRYGYVIVLVDGI